MEGPHLFLSLLVRNILYQQLNLAALTVSRQEAGCTAARAVVWNTWIFYRSNNVIWGMKQRTNLSFTKKFDFV